MNEKRVDEHALTLCANFVRIYLFLKILCKFLLSVVTKIFYITASRENIAFESFSFR